MILEAFTQALPILFSLLKKIKQTLLRLLPSTVFSAWGLEAATNYLYSSLEDNCPSQGRATWEGSLCLGVCGFFHLFNFFSFHFWPLSNGLMISP